MNVLNFYTSLYGALYNRRWMPKRMLSPIRYAVRKMANWHIPRYLKKNDDVRNGGREGDLIVSFTSFPARIDKVWMVVECMKRQTVLPEKIILWLSKEQFPSKDTIPWSLWGRCDDLFEIRMVDEDLKSHKKYYYAFQEYEAKCILLIDDDIFYPETMIEDIVNVHQKHPNAIICRYGYKMAWRVDGTLKKYREWKLLMHPSESCGLFFGSGGGTLVRPDRMYHDACRKDLFLSLCPMADDVWLNAMAILGDMEVIKISSGLICPILEENDTKLKEKNVLGGLNDVQVANVINYYQILLGRILFQKHIT